MVHINQARAWVVHRSQLECMGHASDCMGMIGVGARETMAEKCCHMGYNGHAWEKLGHRHGNA
jgi:hypothetical protein